MWRKARENDKGEYEHADIKDVAEKLIENEKGIEEGSIKPDQGTDSLTLVFGKEHSGFLKGVGQGVTATKYWHLPRTKSSSKEEIAQLKLELDNERRKNEAKDKQVEELSTTLQAVEKHLTSQGLTIPNLSTTSNDTTPAQKILPKSQQSSANEAVKPVMRVETLKDSQKNIGSTTESSNGGKASHINQQSVSSVEVQELSKTRKCKHSYPTMRNVVAQGTIYHSLERQTIHGVPLEDDCYRVSVDESIKPFAFLPISSGDLKTVGSAEVSFIAWPKKLVTFEKPLSSHQEKEKQEYKKKIEIYNNRRAKKENKE